MTVETPGNAGVAILLSALVLLPFVLWMGGAVLAAWLAETKGRNAVLWLLLAIVLGPLALIAVGLSPRAAGWKYEPCPVCRELIAPQARRCPYCVADLDDELDPTENPYLPRS